jgi:hypothetical protein
MASWSTGDSAIDFTEQTRGMWKLEPVEMGDMKTGIFDDLVDLPVHIAPNTDNFLDRIEAILPDGNLSQIAAAVFEKDKAAPWGEDATNLGEGRRDIADRAEGEGCDGAVEGLVREWKSVLGIEPHPGDRDWRGCDSCADDLIEHQFRVDDG